MRITTVVVRHAHHAGMQDSAIAYSEHSVTVDKLSALGRVLELFDVDVIHTLSNENTFTCIRNLSTTLP